jgi:hypothetical protein
MPFNAFNQSLIPISFLLGKFYYLRNQSFITIYLKNSFYLKHDRCLDYLEYIMNFISLNIKFFKNIFQTALK